VRKPEPVAEENESEPESVSDLIDEALRDIDARNGFAVGGGGIA
jgi:hypothetical protein